MTVANDREVRRKGRRRRVGAQERCLAPHAVARLLVDQPGVPREHVQALREHLKPRGKHRKLPALGLAGHARHADDVAAAGEAVDSFEVVAALGAAGVGHHLRGGTERDRRRCLREQKPGSEKFPRKFPPELTPGKLPPAFTAAESRVAGTSMTARRSAQSSQR